MKITKKHSEIINKLNELEKEQGETMYLYYSDFSKKIHAIKVKKDKNRKIGYTQFCAICTERVAYTMKKNGLLQSEKISETENIELYTLSESVRKVMAEDKFVINLTQTNQKSENNHIEITNLGNDLYKVESFFHVCTGFYKRINVDAYEYRLDKWFDKETKRYKGGNNKRYAHMQSWFAHLIHKNENENN